MSGDPFDAQGEAREALRTAVGSYGDRVLNDPRILGNLVTDLLPDSPRERSLLVTAAEAGVASELSQHVQQQHLDVDTAVALVARGLTERRSIDIAASTWVATEYAQALGYQVRSAPPVPQFDDDDESPATATVRRPRSAPPAGPFGGPSSQPPAGFQQPGGYQQPSTPPPFPPAQSPGTAPLFPGQQSQSPQAPPLPFGQERGYQPTVFQQPPSAPQTPYGQPSSQPPAGFGQPPSQPPAGPPTPYQQPSSQPPAGFQQGAPQGASYQPPSYQQGPSQPQPPYPGAPQPAGYQPFPGPGGAGPTQPPGWQGSQPAVGKQGRSRKGLLYGGIGGGVVVIVAVVAIILALSPSPKTNTHPNASGSGSSGHTTAPPKPTPTPSPSFTPATLTTGITPLVKVLPTDITDFESQCQSQTPKQLPFPVVGLVSALMCNDPDLPNGVLYAVQSDTAHDYELTFQAFNKWWGLDTGSAKLDNNCPPTSGKVQGFTSWNNDLYPTRGGQDFECEMVNVSGSSSQTQPDITWSFPTAYSFIDAQGGAGTSYATLIKWWENNNA